MIFEIRTYKIHPGHLSEYLADFERNGLPVISRYAQLVGYWITEVGPLNQVVHMWAYPDAGARAELRAQLYADPEWVHGYLPAALIHVQSQEVRLLKAASFSPIK